MKATTTPVTASTAIGVLSASNNLLVWAPPFFRPPSVHNVTQMAEPRLARTTSENSPSETVRKSQRRLQRSSAGRRKVSMWLFWPPYTGQIRAWSVAHTSFRTVSLVLRSSKAVYINAGQTVEGGRRETMPKLLRARAPQNAEEECKIRKLARSRHAPGDWIARARIISL